MNISDVSQQSFQLHAGLHKTLPFGAQLSCRNVAARFECLHSAMVLDYVAIGILSRCAVCGD